MRQLPRWIPGFLLVLVFVASWVDKVVAFSASASGDVTRRHWSSSQHSPSRLTNLSYRYECVKNGRQSTALSSISLTSTNESQRTLRVGILGAGAIALATAALLSQAGHNPMLWSPSEKSLPTDADWKVSVTGKLEFCFSPRVATSEVDLARQNEILIICLPANGHKQVMDSIAPYLMSEHSVIVSSHASFGALYLSQLLFQRGVSLPITAWGTTVATARRPEKAQVRINTIRNAIDFCTIPSSYSQSSVGLCRQLFPQIGNFVERDGIVGIALSNLNPQNHLGIAIGNMSRMEKGEDWYQSLHITPAIGRLLEGLDAERLAIADACQVRVKTIFEHFALSFHVPQTDNISEMNQEIHRRGNDVLGPNTAESRYILEDVPFGLVPTIILGRLVNKPAVLHEAGVALISSMYGRDFMAENDLLDALNLQEYTLDDLVRAGETGVLAKKMDPVTKKQTVVGFMES